MTYDERQAAAVRVICAVCRRPFDMVQPRPVCFDCRGGNGPPPKVDVSGNLIDGP